MAIVMMTSQSMLQSSHLRRRIEDDFTLIMADQGHSTDVQAVVMRMGQVYNFLHTAKEKSKQNIGLCWKIKTKKNHMNRCIDAMFNSQNLIAHYRTTNFSLLKIILSRFITIRVSIRAQKCERISANTNTNNGKLLVCGYCKKCEKRSMFALF